MKKKGLRLCRSKKWEINVEFEKKKVLNNMRIINEVKNKWDEWKKESGMGFTFGMVFLEMQNSFKMFAS